MTHTIMVKVKCPNCQESMMDEQAMLDDAPAIALEAKMGEKLGKIYLSQEYGSFEKRFDGVDDVVGTVATFSCPSCHQPLPVVQMCDCKAPMVGMQLNVGGMIKICSRNGCKRHALEFEDVNDAFMLFMRQDTSGLG